MQMKLFTEASEAHKELRLWRAGGALGIKLGNHACCGLLEEWVSVIKHTPEFRKASIRSYESRHKVSYEMNEDKAVLSLLICQHGAEQWECGPAKAAQCHCGIAGCSRSICSLRHPRECRQRRESVRFQHAKSQYCPVSSVQSGITKELIVIDGWITAAKVFTPGGWLILDPIEEIRYGFWTYVNDSRSGIRKVGVLIVGVFLQVCGPVRERVTMVTRLLIAAVPHERNDDGQTCKDKQNDSDASTEHGQSVA